MVQRAVVEVLNAIYETDFVGFSYGFRPGRSPHQALDALAVGIWHKKVNWVLDADLRAFFDTLDHGWLVRFLEHRVADQRVLRLIQKWLKAGVLANGQRIRSAAGTVQGGSISPLLGNIYLHYVFDLWVHRWRRKQAHGDVVVVRFADDFVVGFQQREDAERYQEELRERLAQFGLRVAGRQDPPDPSSGAIRPGPGGERRPGNRTPFNFLGFTHICGKTRKGGFTVLRRTMRKRWQAKLREVKVELLRRLHWPVPVVGEYLGAVVRGHNQYYGVPLNYDSLRAFRWAVGRLWWQVLRRRSQTSRLSWTRMGRHIERWLPPAHICHPYPGVRLRVTT